MPRSSVLLVDDDDIFLKEYAQIFRARNYRVLIARSGKETKKIIKKVHPNIALLDKKLSDMDGQDLIKEFKSKSKNTSLVIVTAYANLKSTIEGLREGVADYMIKPVDPDRVLKRVDDLIKSQDAQKAHLRKLRNWAALQNQKYKCLFENSCGGIFIIDASDGTVVDCNSSASILTGYKKSALVGKDLFSIFPSDDRPKHEGFFNSCLKNSPMTMETEIIDSKKNRIPVSVSASFLKIGRKPYIQVIMHDLKRLAAATSKAKEQKHKYQLIAETALEGIYQVDIEGKFIFVNKAFTDIFGYSADEMFGKNFMFIVRETFADKVGSMIKRALNGDAVRGECICSHQTGRDVFVYLSIVPLKREDRIAGFTGILLDITQTRFLEDKLKDHARHLEEAVEKRTRELKKALSELEMVNQKLKIDDALKSEFVANASHEIKNPLFLVRESIASVRDGVFGAIDEKAVKSLDIAHKEIDRLLRLTGNMLDLIKLELGKMPLKKENFDLRSILEDLLFSYKNEFKKKNLELVVDAQPEPLFVMADKDLIKEVVMNLLNNAYKYSPEGGHVALKVYDTGEHARLEIIDQGPGIEADMREKIFDKFFRIFMEKEQGTGLGLSIVRAIIDAHEGRIWVEAAEGGGSKFIVLLKKQ